MRHESSNYWWANHKCWKFFTMEILLRYCHETCLVFIFINNFWWSHNEKKKQFVACFSFIWLFLSTSPSKTYLFYDIFFLVKLISCYFSYIHMLQLKSRLFWRLCIGTKNSDIDILSTLPFRSDFYCSCSLFLFCQTSLKIATKPKCIEWAKYFLSRPKRWFIFVF